MKTATHNEIIVDALTNLIESAHNSEEGLRTAAEGVEHSDLSTILERYAQQRARYAADLAQEIRSYGGDSDTEGSLGGSLRVGWMNLKTALTGGDIGAILHECVRAEQLTVEHYEDALKEDLPEYLKEMIRQQHDEILDSLQHMRALRQSHQPADAT